MHFRVCNLESISKIIVPIKTICMNLSMLNDMWQKIVHYFSNYFQYFAKYMYYTLANKSPCTVVRTSFLSIILGYIIGRRWCLAMATCEPIDEWHH